MQISLIVAMSENHVIGCDGRMPWHLPEDLKRFRRITQGHAVIMGRKTYEAIGHPLSKRENIILTRQTDFSPPNVHVCSTLDQALEYARAVDRPHGTSQEEVFIIGGGEIYRQAIGRADRIYLTLIHQQIEGDTTFPAIDPRRFVQIERTDCPGEPPYSFIDYERVKGI